MKKFDSVVNRVLTNLLAEDVPPGIPQNGGPVAPPPEGQPPAAAPAPAPAAPKPLTSEGKKFLVELALKALAVNPDTINEQDKTIFETQVTTSNADVVADRIRQVIEGL